MTDLPDDVSTWLDSLNKALDGLPEAEREEVMAEAQAHIRDRLDQGLTGAQSLDGFGSADAYAEDFLDTYRVERALEGRHHGQMIATLWTLWQRRLNALFGLVGAVGFSLLAVGGLTLGIARLLMPGRVQIWVSDRNMTLFIDPGPHAPLASDMVQLDTTAILAWVMIFVAGCAYMAHFSLVACLAGLKSRIRRDIDQTLSGFGDPTAYAQTLLGSAPARSLRQRLMATLGRLHRLVIAVVGLVFAVKFGDVVLNNLDTVRKLILHPHTHAFWLGPNFSYFGDPSPTGVQPGMHPLPYPLEYGRLLGVAVVCFYLARFALIAALKAWRPRF